MKHIIVQDVSTNDTYMMKYFGLFNTFDEAVEYGEKKGLTNWWLDVLEEVVIDLPELSEGQSID